MTDKELLASPVNTWERVRYREAILDVERLMDLAIKQGRFDSWLDRCTLTHYFSPKHDEYGCYQYSRMVFMPAGGLATGKIHRLGHLNYVMKGVINVSSEYGRETFEAPAIFVSAPGTKRIAYIVEDVLWSTVHMVKHTGIENLDKIEAEIFAENYSQIGFISSTAELQRLQNAQREIAA